MRGLFEYLYSAEELTLVPHLPDNITALTQNFGVRWGAYRLLLSTSGARSSGVASVTVGGAALAPPHTFNASCVVLSVLRFPRLAPFLLCLLMLLLFLLSSLLSFRWLPWLSWLSRLPSLPR